MNRRLACHLNVFPDRQDRPIHSRENGSRLVFGLFDRVDLPVFCHGGLRRSGLPSEDDDCRAVPSVTPGAREAFVILASGGDCTFTPSLWRCQPSRS